jgi:hypothetical protein
MIRLGISVGASTIETAERFKKRDLEMQQQNEEKKVKEKPNN